MIQNIVFDMGGVLYRFEPDLPYREYPGEDGKILYNAIFGSPDWRRQDLGYRILPVHGVRRHVHHLCRV